MSFKKIFVNCDDSKQAEEVISTALVMGYKRLGRSEQLKDVIMDCNGVVFDSFCEPHKKDDFEVLEYQKFMEKYEMSNLRKKIEEAKKVTGLSASALSEKLGFQHKYLTNAVREASTQRQKEIIAKLDGLIFKEENELTHDFEGKALNVNIDDAIMVSKDEYDSLKKELDHKNQVLDKRNDLYQKLELECKDKDDAIKLQLENVASKILAINELELQLKTTQQKFVDVVDQKDSEIKKLQNDCNHATNQYQGKRAQVVRLNEKVKKQAIIYLIIIVIISLIGIMGFAS